MTNNIPNNQQPARRVAADLLNQFDPQWQTLKEALPKFLANTDERNVVMDIAFGVIRNRELIDAIIETIADVRLTISKRNCSRSSASAYMNWCSHPTGPSMRSLMRPSRRQNRSAAKKPPALSTASCETSAKYKKSLSCHSRAGGNPVLWQHGHLAHVLPRRNKNCYTKCPNRLRIQHGYSVLQKTIPHII